MNKKGNFMGLLTGGVLLIGVAIIGIVIVLISVAWLYGFGLLTDSLVSIPATSNVTNVSSYAQTTFGNLNLGFQSLRWISFFIIFSMLIVIFFSYFLVKMHPAFFGVYLIIVVIAIIFSIYISNAFSSLSSNSGVIGQSLQAFVGTSYILSNLPLIITIMAFLGGIFLFVNLRDREQGGLI